MSSSSVELDAIVHVEDSSIKRKGKVPVPSDSDSESEPILRFEDSESEQESIGPKKVNAMGKVSVPVDYESETEVVAVPKKGTPKKGKSKAKPKKNDEDDEDDNEDDEKIRRVKTPIERIDWILQKLDESGVTKEVVSQLLCLRKQLDGAKIKSPHSSRPPTRYNLYMREKMAELKDNGMKPKDRFKLCIEMWNEEKEKK